MNTTSFIQGANHRRSVIQGITGTLAFLWFIMLPPANTAELMRYEDHTGSVFALNAPDERMTVEVSAVHRTMQPVQMSQHELKQTVRSEAKQHRLSPALLWAVIKAESNFNAAAVSARGAIGLMQLMPATAAFVKIDDPHDPVENIRGGARYLRYLLNKFNENLPLALAAYNAGPAHVRRHQDQIPPISETQVYVERVLALYDSLQTDMAASPS